MNLGKADLLAWLNQAMQTDYLSMQSLSDGIAYAQLLDAVHPGSLLLTKLNLTPKYPEDNLRNLRLVQDTLKKLKITQPASFDKMSRGNFQDHIIFLQWLHAYSNRNGAENLRYYTAYNKRQRVLEKQGRNTHEMAPHLIPKHNYLEDDQDWEVGQEAEEEIQREAIAANVDNRLAQVDEFVTRLQNELRELMELNWRMMFNIDRSIEERNSLHNLLENIDRVVEDSPNSPLKDCLKQILHELPEEYE